MSTWKTRYWSIAFAVAVAGILAGSAACGSSSPSAREQPLRVVASVAPITSLAENIGGTKIELTGLVREDTDPSNYSPSDIDKAAIASADLLIFNGLGLDQPAVEAARAAKGDDAELLLLGEKAGASTSSQAGTRAWLDPQVAAEYARAIHDELARLDEDHKEYYDANLREFENRIEAMNQQIKVSVQTVPAGLRTFVTFDRGWSDWAARYGVATTVSAPLSTHPIDIESAAAVFKQASARALFGSPRSDERAAKTVAAQAGVKYGGVLQDEDLPGGPGDDNHSYIGMMVENMRILVPALGGDPAPMVRVKTGLVFQDGPSPAKYAS